MTTNSILKINEATLRLFKSIYVADDSKLTIDVEGIVNLTKKGIILDPKILFSDSSVIEPTVDSIISMYGKDIVKFSNTFHKSWRTVEEIDPELHYIQQILHYLTTYGYESIGIDYNEDNVYIPEEKVAIPEGVTPFSFIVIKALTKKELILRINTLFTTGVALSQQQVKDLIYLVNELKLELDFNTISNKEIRAALWLELEDKPYINVDEFLRALIYKVTGETLLVRSYRDHQKLKMYLKNYDNLQSQVRDLLEEYISKFGMKNIASQFLRNKMIFLGLKCNKTKAIINKIRRVADKYHEPQDEVRLSLEDVERANIWQLVKYYNLCSSNLNPTEDKLYQVRNGRNFLKEGIVYDDETRVERNEHFTTLQKAIENKIKEELSYLKGTTLIIPDYLDYKVPTSLKRLIEGIPEGSSISLPENSSFVLGVHWTNLPKDKIDDEDDFDEYCDYELARTECRVDLDIHANSLNNQIGWYSGYKNEDVLYSGDMTHAPIDKGGASEALLFKHTDTPYLITLCDYTMYDKVPFKLLFDFETKQIPNGLDHRNNQIFGNIFSQNAITLNSEITKQGQKTLGLVGHNKFYFTSGTTFTGPVTYRSELLNRLTSYYEESQVNNLSIRQLASIVGFEVVSSKDEIVENLDTESKVVDLSLEAITQDTFPNLFTKPEDGGLIEETI